MIEIARRLLMARRPQTSAPDSAPTAGRPAKPQIPQAAPSVPATSVRRKRVPTYLAADELSPAGRYCLALLATCSAACASHLAALARLGLRGSCGRFSRWSGQARTHGRWAEQVQPLRRLSGWI